ncbi:MAG: NTP transferase domain-containing protein [Bacteroidia bacterium]|nr:NTP transferase domain-containing protein [Bacteroidia bacterium]
MKVIIPVAGIGSKLRPHTHTQPKALVPVAGKPILSHIVDNLIEAGLREFIFIVGYMGNKVEEYIRTTYPGIDKTFIVQEPREGTGHAVWQTRHLIREDDELIIALGDSIFDVQIRDILSLEGSLLGVKKVDDPRSFGVAELNEDGSIRSVIEKPPIPKSNLALVGLYKIKEGRMLMDALNQLIARGKSGQGEYQLTDGIMNLIQKGAKIRPFTVEHWYDCGSKDSLLETNAVLLKKTVPGTIPHNFENTIIIAPVRIADNCKISNSIIGPNVSVGDHTIINYSILKDAIIGSFSEIRNAVLHHSVIGNDASLHGQSQSLNLGDSTEIDFG